MRPLGDLQVGASLPGEAANYETEVALAAPMAAGALVAALRGSDDQATYAAGIALERTLAPICSRGGGPAHPICVELSALGPAKAIEAGRIAIEPQDGDNISLDQAIEILSFAGLDKVTEGTGQSSSGSALNWRRGELACKDRRPIRSRLRGCVCYPVDS